MVAVVHTRSELRAELVRLKRQGKLRRLPRVRKTFNPKRAETEYYLVLKKLFASLRTRVVARVMKRLPDIVDELAPRADSIDARMDAKKRDILTKELDGVTIAFGREVARKDLLGPIGKRAASKSKREWNERVGTVLGIDLKLAEPWLGPLIERYSKSNADLITNVSERYTDRVSKVVREAVESGVRAEELESKIRSGLGPQGEGIDLDARARLIARDQVAKLTADIDRERQQAIGVKRYTWRTSNDERVRESHRERDGLVFEWDRDFEEQLQEYGLEPDTIDGHIQSSPNCRCRAEPVLDDIVEGLPSIDGSDAGDEPADPLSPTDDVTFEPPPAPLQLPPETAPHPSGGAYVEDPNPQSWPEYRGIEGAPTGRFDQDRLFGAAGKATLDVDDQRIVRQELRELIARYGVVSRDVTRKSDGALTVRVAPSLDRNAAASHSGNGRINMNANVAQNLARYANGERTNQSARFALEAMLHEEMHGHSPMLRGAMSSIGRVIEEVTTEVTARAVFSDHFSQPDPEPTKAKPWYVTAPPALGPLSRDGFGSYNELIDGFLAPLWAGDNSPEGFRKADAERALVRASFEFKQTSQRYYHDVTAFNDLTDSILRDDVFDSIDRDRLKAEILDRVTDQGARSFPE